MFHFVDWYYQLPGEPLLKRILSVTDLRARCVLGFEWCRVEERAWVDGMPIAH